ncbi:toll/interleukin-1 receptor domain-containing protein [Paractinoplanes rishiriensis]|uniref:TIR domain-containing protein n=1 Tax=Paractinoplanes rishiriensis TaxID=1050105 RepID=A0A919N2D4_9ACTN|nr:TIR domain-containing protein [Actinoplanes rishiriensis]GIE99547.1 hypothetical protein Ari01nite_70120 [Actinoplanes rishiriensis]
MGQLGAKRTPPDGYAAFISYSHAQDRLLSAALQSELERFAGSWWHPRRMRVFRDETNLTASPGLWPSIVDSMRAAEWFILLASPGAAGSVWVRREVAWWVANKSPDRMLIALTSGRVHWSGDDFDWSRTDAVPPTLAGVFPDEPHWIDLSRVPAADERPQLGDTVAKLAAPILGVDEDTLAGEHVRQRRRTRRTVWGVVVTLTALLLAVSTATVAALVQADRQREQAGIAAARELATLADGLVSSDPRTALGLSLAGTRIRSSPESEQAVYRTLAATRYLSTLAGHRAAVKAVAFAGSLLATGSDDHTVRLWDLTDPARPRPVGAPVDPGVGPVAALAFEPGTRRLAVLGVHHEQTGSETTQLALWDTARPFAGRPAPKRWRGIGTSLAFLPGAGLLAVSTVTTFGGSGPLRLWDIRTAEPDLVSENAAEDAGPVYSLAAAADGSFLVTGNAHGDGTDSGGETGVWRLADGPRLERTASLDTGPTTSVAINPAGTVIAALGQDSTPVNQLTLWDARRHRRLGPPMTRHPDAISTIAFAPDGRTLAEARSDQTTLLWDVSDPGRPDVVGEPLAAHSEGVEAVAFSPDGRTLVTASADAQAILWDARGRARPALAQTVPGTPPGGAGRSPALHRLIVAGGTQFGGGFEATTSPDGRLMATVSANQQTTLWDLSSGRAPNRLAVLPTGATADPFTPVLPQFDAAGRYAVTGTDTHDTDSELHLWDLSVPGRPRRQGAPLTGFTRPIALSPDGRLLAATQKGPGGGGVGTVLFDVTDKARPRRITTIDATREALVVSLAFAPDGTMLAVGDDAKTVLFDLSDPANPGRFGRPLTGFGGLVAFAPDGRTMAVASEAEEHGGLTLWDITRRTDPRRIGDPFLPAGAGGGTAALAFGRDGKTLLTGGHDYTIRVWDLSAQTALRADPVGLACRLTDAGLSAREWARYVVGRGYQPGCR